MVFAETGSQRLFFALWPGEALRQTILQHCHGLLHRDGGRPVDPANFHITLAFLGGVDTARQACVEQLADGIKRACLRLCIDAAGHWAKPRILWAGPSKMPEALTSLAMDLHDGALKCGIPMDARPYRAHVTLSRKVARAPARMEISPFVWEVDRFALVKSITISGDVKYAVIREWPLVRTD